ncbi:exopolysaccharide transport family protein [Roseivirga sp. BDSF3-8]|uniref:exopolysaccharide transport family protein n=1 Tax=Roseivirga sp. BDSF3-8 TaxID=3241598 RepID=UPI003531EDC5
MDFVYLFRVLLRKLWILITIPLIAGAITYFLTEQAEERFRSVARLSTGITINNSVNTEDHWYNPQKANIEFNNLLERIKSAQVVSMVSYKLAINDLTEEYPFRVPRNEEGKVIPLTEKEKQEAVEILRDKVENFNLLSNNDDAERELIDLLRAFRYNHWIIESDLKVNRVPNTDYLDVIYTSENPELSAYVVNTLSEEFIRYNQFKKKDNQGQSLDYYNTLVLEKKKLVDEAQTALRTFKEENDLVNYDVDDPVNRERIISLEGQRLDLQEKVQGLQLSLRSINNRINSYGGNDGGSNNNSRILDLRRRIKLLNEQYIRTGSSDDALLDSLNTLRSQLDRLQLNQGSAGGGTGMSLAEMKERKYELETDLAIARSNLGTINSQLNSLRGSASMQAQSGAKINELEKAYDLAVDEYLSAQERLSEAQSLAVNQTVPIRIEKEGEPNYYPVPSKALLFTALSIVVSLALCAFVILGRELIDMRIKRPAQFSRMTKLKLGGYLNDLKHSDVLDLERIFSDPTDKDFQMYKDLVRKLRFELESSGQQVFLITSTKPNQGKSFVLLSLAYSLSLIKKKVLIIDTNFKDNTLTQWLLAKPLFNKYLKEGKVKGGRLLIGARSSASEPEETFQEEEEEDFTRKIISPTVYRNIDIIGSTPGSESPSEIFSGRDFKSMIISLCLNYDYIFMEGASLNEFSDTKELVGYSDRVLPVFSADTTIKSVDKDSIAYLRSLDEKLLPSVLNMVDPKFLKI